MSVYVDSLLDHGWKLRGVATPNAHLFADDVDELHTFAEALGLRRSWFQYKPGRLPHYDLTPGKFHQAKRAGAIHLDRRAAVEKWAEIKAADQLRREEVLARLDQLRRTISGPELDTSPFPQMSTQPQTFGIKGES